MNELETIGLSNEQVTALLGCSGLPECITPEAFTLMIENAVRVLEDTLCIELLANQVNTVDLFKDEVDPNCETDLIPYETPCNYGCREIRYNATDEWLMLEPFTSVCEVYFTDCEYRVKKAFRDFEIEKGKGKDFFTSLRVLTDCYPHPCEQECGCACNSVDDCLCKGRVVVCANWGVGRLPADLKLAVISLIRDEIIASDCYGQFKRMTAPGISWDRVDKDSFANKYDYLIKKYSKCNDYLEIG